MKQRPLLILVCLALTFLAAPLAAEPEATPDGGSLPAPQEAAPAGIAINSGNADQFRTLLVPELFELIKTAGLEIDAAKSLRFQWRYSDEWEQRSSRPPSPEITSEGELKDPGPLAPGLIFGRTANLEAGDMGAPQLGWRILGNLASQWWSLKILDLPFALSAVGGKPPGVTLEGRLQRVYPRSLPGPEQKSTQEFREKISFSTPDFLKGYSWLSFRFFGKTEDMVWVYSPAIQQVRQLTGSNRSDALLTSPVGADDFLAWSGKSELVNPIAVEKVTVLAPFISVNEGRLTESGKCARAMAADLVMKGKEWPSASRLAGENALRELSTAAVFVPREMWRLELAPRDPFSLYGRQVLYVDSEAMLPAYKIVFNRKGQVWKVVLSVYGLASTGSRRVPVNAFSLIFDRIRSTSYLLDYPDVRYCEDYPEDLQLASFDPARLQGRPDGKGTEKRPSADGGEKKAAEGEPAAAEGGPAPTPTARATWTPVP